MRGLVAGIEYGSKVGPQVGRRNAGDLGQRADLAGRHTVLDPPQNGGVRNSKLAGDADGGDLRHRKVFGERHRPIVHSLDNGGKAKCAPYARVTAEPLCDHRGMVKQHPKRPHLMAWRAHVKKTQEWLANEIGTSHSTVLRYERQETGVNDATFAAIAKAYGITVAELSAPPDERDRAKQLDRLLSIVQKLDEEEIQALALIAERMKPPK